MHKIPSKFSQFGFRPWMFQGEGGGDLIEFVLLGKL